MNQILLLRSRASPLHNLECFLSPAKEFTFTTLRGYELTLPPFGWHEKKNLSQYFPEEFRQIDISAILVILADFRNRGNLGVESKKQK